MNERPNIVVIYWRAWTQEIEGLTARRLLLAKLIREADNVLTNRRKGTDAP